MGRAGGRGSSGPVSEDGQLVSWAEEPPPPTRPVYCRSRSPNNRQADGRCTTPAPQCSLERLRQTRAASCWAEGRPWGPGWPGGRAGCCSGCNEGTTPGKETGRARQASALGQSERRSGLLSVQSKASGMTGKVAVKAPGAWGCYSQAGIRGNGRQASFRPLQGRRCVGRGPEALIAACTHWRS